jgi:flagellar protein FlaG
MGFSLTGTHVVFFIASVIIASAVSGVFIAVTTNIINSYSERGNRVQEQLDTDFEIINDPDNIPSSGGFYQFYLKNIGGSELATSNESINIFIDGEIIITANYNFADTSIHKEEVTTLNIVSSDILQGDHTLRIVGPQAIDDEFTFTI